MTNARDIVRLVPPPTLARAGWPRRRILKRTRFVVLADMEATVPQSTVTELELSCGHVVGRFIVRGEWVPCHLCAVEGRR